MSAEPTYCNLSTQVEMLRPWCEDCFEGSEWGEYVGSLWAAAERGVGSVGADLTIKFLLEAVWDEWAAFVEQGGLSEYPDEVAKAQLAWNPEALRPHVYKEDIDAFNEAIALAPDWMKPSPELLEHESRLSDDTLRLMRIKETLFNLEPLDKVDVKWLVDKASVTVQHD